MRSDAFSCAWDNPVGRDLRERLEDEQTLQHAWMRNVEPRLVNLSLVPQQEIQVQRSWPPSGFGETESPLGALHLKAEMEHRTRR